MTDHNSGSDAKTDKTKDAPKAVAEVKAKPKKRLKDKYKAPTEDKHAGEGGTYRINDAGERVKVRHS